MLVTNQPEMVEAARVSYRDFPTALNAIGQSNKTYRNEMSDYAKMDSLANHAQMGIGLSSNLAQLCLSYLWTKKAKNEIDEEYVELYHNCIILATLAQVLIDGIKRSFEVDAMMEVERIQNMSCMRMIFQKVDKDGTPIYDKNNKPIFEKKDLPEFMKYIKEVPFTKDGKEIPYATVKKNREKIINRINYNLICPMNWLVEALNKIQGSNRSTPIDTKEFYIHKPGKADNRQMGALRKIIEEYDAWTKLHIRDKNMLFNKDEYDMMKIFVEKSLSVLESIRKYKISEITMNRLIGSVLGVDRGVNDAKKYKEASKYTRKMLNMMFKYNRKMFLMNFKKA